MADMEFSPTSGSPAHAGMDPLPHLHPHPAGLPRTRGDGPCLAPSPSTSRGAPPHTRGPFISRPMTAGSPAHAGMDLHVTREPTESDRLPRTRGDGPGVPQAPPHTRGWTRGCHPSGPSRSGKSAPTAAPPHTRGWTRLTLEHASVAENGAPPHTRGWTRALPGSNRRSPRLPRTRGDGPTPAWRALALEVAPPHTRGWTLLLMAAAGQDLGSPAHAGMDPRSHPGRSGLLRLPRTRGDGPAGGTALEFGAWAPPHTRGWTRPFRGPAHVGPGSPAHAGMDPLVTLWRNSRQRLPRTRGDGPGSLTVALDRQPAPPHTRGWTRRDRGDAWTISGSPAHAGMDPHRPLPAAWLIRLPRTRGDGPFEGAMNQVRAVAPPHTRGWTLEDTVRAEERVGSPAHAGMDPLKVR